jgi:hypothetical protein
LSQDTPNLKISPRSRRSSKKKKKSMMKLPRKKDIRKTTKISFFEEYMNLPPTILERVILRMHNFFLFLLLLIRLCILSRLGYPRFVYFGFELTGINSRLHLLILMNSP